MIKLQQIQIGYTRSDLRLVKWVSAYKPRNTLSGMAQFGRSGTADLIYKGINRYFIPRIELDFNFKTPAEYSEMIQIINTDDFVLRYDDPDLYDPNVGPSSMDCIRKFKMNSHDYGRLIAWGGNYHGINQETFVAVSVFSYEVGIGPHSYDDLKAKRLVDARIQ